MTTTMMMVGRGRGLRRGCEGLFAIVFGGERGCIIGVCIQNTFTLLACLDLDIFRSRALGLAGFSALIKNWNYITFGRANFAMTTRLMFHRLAHAR